jgi:DNA-binding HxlR family transcriptional regulator
MRQTSFANMHCSLARSLEKVGDWWTPLILRDVFLGLNRFDDLAADLGISRNMLTTRLGVLVESGIVERLRYSERPPRYRYVLTQAGRELVPVLTALTAWGDRWATPPGGPPAIHRHTRCGQAFTPTVTCSECGVPLSTDELEILPGSGARRGPGTALYGSLLRRRGSVDGISQTVPLANT